MYTCKTMTYKTLYICKNYCGMNYYRYPACPKSRVNSSKHMRSAALTVGCVFCKALMKSCKVSLGSSNLSLGTCIHVILIASGSRGLQGVKRSSTVMLGSIGEGPLCVLEVGCHSYFTYRHHEGFLHHSANIGSRVAFCPLSQSAEALW